MSRLDGLLRPKSIAVIGGGSWCENVINELRKIGFTGEVYAVHPQRTEVGGAATFARVNDLPQTPDAAFVGVNREASIEVVRELAAMGAGGAVCFASGFTEAVGELSDGADLQFELIQAAGKMPFLGPNCYGLVNYLDNVALWPDQHGGISVDRGIGIITQSSNIAINLTMQKRGLPIGMIVTAGNQASVGIFEIGQAMLADPRITALGLHIEGINDLRGLEALAHTARDLGKRIVAIKIGASENARAATVSHTASITGSDAGARALLARLGIAQLGSLEVFLETLKILHVTGGLASNRMGSMSCSGGEASLIADMAEEVDVEFLPLVEEQSKALRAVLGPRVALANPLDYHTYIWGDLAAMTVCFTAMMQGDLGIGIVILDFPRGDRCGFDAWHLVIEAVRGARNASGKPMAIIASISENIPEDITCDLIEMGIVPLNGMEAGLAAIEAAAIPPEPDPAPILPPIVPIGAKTINESVAKVSLAAHGLRVPASMQVSDVSDSNVPFPVVLKGEGFAHKTEAGAVVLNVANDAELRAAASRIDARCYLVEEMITDKVVELLIGVVLDPAHGYVLTLGAGGVMTEILQDSQSLILPVTRGDVADALSQLKIAPILNGYRGQPAANMAAIIDAVMAVQDFTIAHHGEITEVEINPLICGKVAAIAADALITIGEKP